jgi:hypothetical protein
MGLLSRVAASTQEFLKGTVENTARATLKWILGMSVSYLIAAALAVAALVFLLGAAVDGLIAAGLPPFGADLILAAVTAGIAFLVFLHGKNRKLTRVRKEEDSRTAYAPGLHVRIVRTSPPRRKSRRTTTRKVSRKREVARVVVHRN